MEGHQEMHSALRGAGPKKSLFTQEDEQHPMIGMHEAAKNDETKLPPEATDLPARVEEPTATHVNRKTVEDQIADLTEQVSALTAVVAALVPVPVSPPAAPAPAVPEVPVEGA